jgi:uncharacterized protein involved in exopolysaccharide biosynthesis
MADQQNSEFNFDSTNFILFLNKWKKPLTILVLFAIVASVIFSSPFFIKPKYKSSVILFPANTNSISKVLIAENGSAKEDIMQFGEEEQAEQLLQILNSDEIRYKVITKYNLMKHYDIDTTNPYKNTLLQKEYESNISYRRTEFMSVEIEVMDTDPKLAADIANDIAALLDTVKNRMQKERAIKGMHIAEAEYLDMKNYIKSLEDSLNVLRSLGVNDYESQVERLYEAYGKALLDNKKDVVTKIESQIKVVSQYGGAYVSIRDILENEKKQLTHLRAKYHEAKIDAEQTLPNKFIVNNGTVAEKKTYPVRWLIVLIAAFSTLIMGILAIVIFEKYQSLVQSHQI